VKEPTSPPRRSALSHLGRLLLLLVFQRVGSAERGELGGHALRFGLFFLQLGEEAAPLGLGGVREICNEGDERGKVSF
jgi:hypothetical protein